MKKEVVHISQIKGFSPLLIDYLNNKSNLQPFFTAPPILSSFEGQIKSKSTFSAKNREVLVHCLQQQYENIGEREGIQLLADPNTFTVTTGHQLNIFTGPLYVIYKIVSTIQLARKLKKQFPDKNFVPIYWLASEDHDFEEINHFFWNNQKHEWKSDQKGAVGRFQVEDLSKLANQFPETVSIFKKAYAASKTLAEAVIRYMDELFGKEGLICLDADQKDLKQLFSDVIAKDVLQQSHEQLVQNSSKKLNDLGYKTQVNARSINFFYLKDGLRERIQKNDKWEVLETDIQFSEEEINNEIASHPERFSPNVILRPLYQETILPNLAYIGGPAEIVYWLQLKAVFDQHQTPFPLLFPRNFATILKKNQREKVAKIGLDLKDLFLNELEIKQLVLSKFGSGEEDLNQQKSELKQLFDQIKQKASKIEKTLDQSVEAHLKKASNAFDDLQKKLAKAEIRNQKEWLDQILLLKSKLFPNGTWQERRDSFLNYYAEHTNFIQELLEQLDPFAFEMNFLTLEA